MRFSRSETGGPARAAGTFLRFLFGNLAEQAFSGSRSASSVMGIAAARAGDRHPNARMRQGEPDWKGGLPFPCGNIHDRLLKDHSPVEDSPIVVGSRRSGDNPALSSGGRSWRAQRPVCRNLAVRPARNRRNQWRPVTSAGGLNEDQAHDSVRSFGLRAVAAD